MQTIQIPGKTGNTSSNSPAEGPLRRLLKNLSALLAAPVLLTGCAAWSYAPMVNIPRGEVSEGVKVFTNARIITMTEEEPKWFHGSVLVRGETISYAGPDLPVIDGGKVVDCGGRWMIPGLADAHVHLLFYPADPLLFLANGVTAVRDMGGPTPEAKGHKTLAWDDHLALRSQIAAGEVLGPTLYAASSIHEAPSGAYFDRRLYVPVKNEAQALATLREAEEAGFDYYKIYNKFPAEALAAVAREADRLGLPVAGHVPHGIALQEVLENKLMHSIEHLTGYINPFGDFKFPADQIEEMALLTAEAGVWNVPTLEVWRNLVGVERIDHIMSNPWSPYLPESTRKIWSNGLRGFSKRIEKQVPGYSVLPSQHMEDFEALFQALHRAGAPIAAGSDSGILNVIAGASLIDELTAYVRLGMTPWEALRTATSEAARCFQDEGTFGVIAPGARADFLLLDQNPLEDITNLGTLDTVVLRGTVYPREELMAKLNVMKEEL